LRDAEHRQFTFLAVKLLEPEIGIVTPEISLEPFIEEDLAPTQLLLHCFRDGADEVPLLSSERKRD
jgi:hypothetical protein